MTGQQPQKTLVALIKETGWWPPDIKSRYRDPDTGEFSNRCQNVVLESIDTTDHVPPVRWKIHFENRDSASLPLPFTRYDMICELTEVPTFCTVVVAAEKSVNPLTDCCAFVPFGLSNATLTPKGRIELGEQALVAVLKIIDQWPPLDLKKYLLELFPGSIWLEPIREVTYDPAEWTIDGEGVYQDVIVRYYLMTNKRAKCMVTVGIAAAKQKRPENIDPYRDCWASIEGVRVPFSLRLRGFKPASKQLCRSAIAAYLDSLGAWPPERDITTQRPERLVIREALSGAIAAVARFNPSPTSDAGLNVMFLETLLSRHEDKPISTNRALAIERFGGLRACIEKAQSLEEVEQAFAQFHIDTERMRNEKPDGR